MFRTYNKILYLQKQYDEAQTTVLNKIYDDIKSRFVDLYRLLHGSDEASFDANMERSKSGIGLRVDFHEQGQFPPAAYHSEGHQDSMGIALFFSLMERLACKEKGIIVLDDVVMSVDIDHRLAFCDMLRNVFSDYQFLITTHDAIWEKYLEKHKIVDKRNAFNFVNWSVELGPEIITKKDVWSECEKRADEDLNSAAHYLRREMETYFEEVCDSLNAEIKYNSECKWDLGQYYNAAYKAMKKDLSKAKKHAEKYKMTDKSNIIENRIDELAKAKENVDCNNWITNNLVHRNSDQFSRREFSTAIESLKMFVNCFRCDSCGGNTLYSI